MTVLIDADIVAYRASYSAEELEVSDAEEKVDELLEYILEDTTFDGTPCELYLTGNGNFRYDVATTVEYKGNRRGTQKPRHLDHVRHYLQRYWDATMSEGEEADDLIGIRATQLFPDCVMASVDKDFLQIPGWHYNTRTGVRQYVSEWDGLKFFYQQILTGDRADNIQGLKGIGPKKSEKMLAEATTEQELYDVCVAAYGNPERVLENGRLLWLRREVGQLWEPPR